jgi:type IV secretory pathway component VirB8
MQDENIPTWAIELIKQVERLNEKIPSHVDWATRNILDHEDRIRDLEKARWSSAWITAIASAALTAAVVVSVTSLL